MKILVLLSRFPYPLEKGDKLRAFQHLNNIAASGHEIHLVALSDEKVSDESLKKIKLICKSVEVIPISVTGLFINLTSSLLRMLPFQVGYFYSLFSQIKISKAVRKIKPDLVYCQLIRMAWYARNIKNIPLVIDYQDAFSIGTFQRMKKSPWMYKTVFEREYNLVKKFEAASYNWFHSHIIISEQDRLGLSVPPEKKIHIIPNGIDTSFFQPSGDSKVFDVSFVGNMNYPPNIDGAIFLVKAIMPLVWEKFPETKVQIAGANPSKKIRALATRNVTVTGWVADIRDCYTRTRIFTAPMISGTGLQNKLLEAMAMSVPCVTTTLSFVPLNAKNNHDILVGDNSRELADHIIKLLSDPDHAEKIGKNGYYFIKENYSLENSRVLLEDVFNEAIVNFNK